MASPRARLLLAAAAALAACGGPGGPPAGGGQPVDFTIAGLAFHVSDGAVATSAGNLVFYLSDQPDACLAVTAVPVGTAMLMTLRIAPPAGGATSVTVVPPSPAPPLLPAPAPGQAMGGLTRAIGGAVNARVDAANGSLSWVANPDGSVTIGTIDVGFAPTLDRLTTYGLRLRPCP